MPQPAVASPAAEKYLRLHLCPEVGPIRFANLLRELGGIDAALSATHRQLCGVRQVGEKVADQIVRGREEADVNGELALAAEHGVRILCLADDEYPAILRHIPDPPTCLYIRGTLVPEDGLALAVVGSRHCSRYGAEQAERFGGLAATAGLTVVSGLARGIDTAAHRGALGSQGRTLAVIGCGLSHLYPPESGDLAAAIVERGALLSELPMRVPPDSKNFPARNRIIVGLSLGVLVVEAGQRSGALISARLANEYNREVFAVPGRVDTPQSEGCHDLIKRSSAKLVTRFEDIVEELGTAGCGLAAPVSGENRPSPSVATVRLEDHEARIAAILAGGSLSIEELCEAAELTPAQVAVALTGLQLKGVVRRLLGEVYERTAPA